MLRLFGSIAPGGVSLTGDVFEEVLTHVPCLAQNRLTERQRRGRLMPAIVVSAPQRRCTVELLEHGQNDPGGIVYRSRIAAPVIGQEQRLVTLGAHQKTRQ